MEETTVLIVGAGPSGLALAVNLGRMNIKTIILEKELEVAEDPRGIVITGDAVRISYQLGIGDSLVTKIGSDIGILYFHSEKSQNPPFMNFDTNFDYLKQSVSNAIAQFQPNYERTLRSSLASLPSCDLRDGCEMVSRIEEENGVVVEYLDKKGDKKSIRASWLVGADGKRGIVRKKFLEPEGVRQEVGLYNHVSTWVAANFEVTLPTPATHPDFPLWKLGYSPEEVHKLFWPSGFHFCNDIKRPSVSGRFGPKGARLWRHEYSVEPEDNLDDPVAHLWAQFGPWLEIPGSRISSTLDGTTVTYPRDCVNVIRCRPFTFATRVVNKWYIRRTILIGDAAHVFPPFGGQGIASGIRDAQALSWRLALLSRLSVSPSVRDKLLTGWAHERRQVCDHATKLTKINGSITNLRSAVVAFAFRVVARLLWRVPFLVKLITRAAIGDTFQYQECRGLFALRALGGGWKLPQIWVQRGQSKPQLSDEVFVPDMARLALIVILRGDEEADETGVTKLVERVALPGGMLTEESVTFLRLGDGRATTQEGIWEEQYRPCTAVDLLDQGIKPIEGYDEKSLEKRIGRRAKYVILRPDFYIHSIAADEQELVRSAREVANYFESEEED